MIIRPIALLALILCVTSCRETPAPPAVQPVVDGPAAPAAVGAEGANPDARRQRLLRFEHACDQWYSAWTEQEFARMASLDLLLRDNTNREFAGVLDDLQNGSPRHKRVMAAALGFSGRAEAVPPLLAALEEQYYEVVMHALFSLYHLGGPGSSDAARAAVHAVPPEKLVSYLTHPRPEVRSNAALALSRMVTAATPKPVLLALLSVSDDAQPRVRLHAIAALSAMRAAEAYPQFVKALSDDTPLVQVRAAIALGLLGKLDAAPYLIEVLARADSSSQLKHAAMRALAQILGEPASRSEDPVFWRELAARRGVKF